MVSKLQILLALLAVLILLYIFFKRAAANMQPVEEEESVSPMLCKFVSHEGSIVGEVVAVEEDQLVLKQSGQFKAVPAALAELHGDDVVLTGEVDWDAAHAAGAEWKDAVTKGVDAEVTEHLTKSEDVKSPALEAFNKRQAELDEEE